jgi:release factor glutamine methyltransferase
MSYVYPSSDDTFFLLDVLKDEKITNNSCLEIGVGTGVIAAFLAEKNTVDGVDINHAALTYARKICPSCTLFYSDLFSHVTRQYDVIVFNPPYLPEKRELPAVGDRSWHGGRDGRVVIDTFLASFHMFLQPGGVVYLLQSSFCSPDKTITVLKKRGFHVAVLKRKRLFFEELTVIKTRRKIGSTGE